MGESTKECDRTTTCMGEAPIYGRIGEGMRASISMTRSMDTAYTNELMEGSIKAAGRTASNTERDST